MSELNEQSGMNNVRQEYVRPGSHLEAVLQKNERVLKRQWFKDWKTGERRVAPCVIARGSGLMNEVYLAGRSDNMKMILEIGSGNAPTGIETAAFSPNSLVMALEIEPVRKLVGGGDEVRKDVADKCRDGKSLSVLFNRTDALRTSGDMKFDIVQMPFPTPVEGKVENLVVVGWKHVVKGGELRIFYTQEHEVSAESLVKALEEKGANPTLEFLDSVVIEDRFGITASEFLKGGTKLPVILANK